MKIHVFQIGQASQTPVDGTTILPCELHDNWGAYQAITTFFQQAELDADALYGFVMPDFWQKTGLDMASLEAYIAQDPAADVHILLPDPLKSACFLSAFGAAEFEHPGVMNSLNEFLQLLELDINPERVIQDWRHIATVNYIFAKPVFWQTWFSLAEKVREITVMPGLALGAEFKKIHPSCGQTMGQSAIAWLASIVLALDRELLIHPDTTGLLASENSDSQQRKRLDQLVSSRDAFLASGDGAALDHFYALRNANLTDKVIDDIAQVVRHKRNTELDRESEGLVYGCINRQQPAVSWPSQVHVVHVGDALQPGQIEVDRFAPQWLPYKNIIPSLVGLFAFKNYICKHHPDAKRIGVASDDYFVSVQHIPGAHPSQESPVVDEITAHQLAKTDFSEVIRTGGASLIIGKQAVFNVGARSGVNYLAVYAHSKHRNIEDLLHYTAIAVELGVISPAEVEQFFATQKSYNGGLGTGVFPAEFWLGAIDVIESIVWDCVHRYPEVRFEKKKQAWTYCSELFGSYLLLKYLSTYHPSPNDAQTGFGQLNRIV